MVADLLGRRGVGFATGKNGKLAHLLLGSYREGSNFRGVGMKPLRVFIGWDSREDIAYQVCRWGHASVANIQGFSIEVRH
jgi:hypothetical protein